MTLLGYVEEHRGAFEYDWRTRFHAPFDPPRSMSWGEVWRLFQRLLADPSSHVAAAVAGWSRPASWEWMVLADLYDAFAAVNSKSRPKAYPRPWRDQNTVRYGSARRPQEEIRAALRARGHDI